MAHAKHCYENYETIVNEIPKFPNIYNYDMQDFAEADNRLAEAQLAIGESSNLAQLCLTYTYNYDAQKYSDYVCTLSVLAQVAIDNAKRSFDISLPEEIKNIKEDMDISKNGLPYFWLIVKKDKRKARNDEERKERQRKNKEKIKAQINPELQCPMNYLYSLELNKYRSTESTIPIEKFFIKHEQDQDRRKSKAVEELIQKYSFNLHKFYMDHEDVSWSEDDDMELMMLQFDELIRDIQSIYISKNYLGLMSWLINRAFCIGSGAKGKKDSMKSNTDKNKAALLKVLYTVNKDAFLACFSVQQQKNEV